MYKSLLLASVLCLVYGLNLTLGPTASNSNRDENDEVILEDDVFWQVLSTFLEARKSGLSHEEITRNVFGVDHLRHIPGHPHSYPFLSGDTLQAFADIYYDETLLKGQRGTTFQFVNGLWTLKGFRGLKKHDRVHVPKDGDVIFIKADHLEKMAKKALNQLNTTFILITQNALDSVPNGPHSRELLENPKLIRWFAKNPSGPPHPKIEAIPIGLENQRFNYSGSLDFLDRDQGYVTKYYDPNDADSAKSKPELMLMNFAASHNPIRGQIIRPLLESGFAWSDRGSIEDYHKSLSVHKFVLSPPGAGLDCHRTWEGIFFGTIPVVLNSTLWPLYKESPVLVVNSLESITREDLLKFRLPSKSRTFLLAQYWFDRINSFRFQPP